MRDVHSLWSMAFRWLLHFSEMKNVSGNMGGNPIGSCSCLVIHIYFEGNSRSVIPYLLDI